MAVNNENSCDCVVCLNVSLCLVGEDTARGTGFSLPQGRWLRGLLPSLVSSSVRSLSAGLPRVFLSCRWQFAMHEVGAS